MQKIKIAVIAGLVVLAGVFGWLGYQVSRSQQSLTEGPFGVPFTLVDQKGQPATEQVLRGKPTLLFFGFTHCPEVCPTTLFEMDGWLRAVDPDGTRLQAYMITVDPARDTPEVLDEYVSSVAERVHALGGDEAEIANVLRGYRVYARKVPIDSDDPDGDYTMDHTASVYLLDGEGRFRGTISYGEDSDMALDKLRRLAETG